MPSVMPTQQATKQKVPEDTATIERIKAANAYPLCGIADASGWSCCGYPASCRRKVIPPLCCKQAKLTLVRDVVEAHCEAHGNTDRSAGWQPVETMPEARSVQVMTITGVICFARRPKGYRIRPATGKKPPRVFANKRRPPAAGGGRDSSMTGSADLAVIAWREPGAL